MQDDASEDSQDSFDALLRSIARTPRVLRAGAVLGAGRFTILRVLGQGGMGTVYEAQDELRGHPVALKTLTGNDPQRAYRLKHEFRALANVAHPNLVALHELFAGADTWFFTMDLVSGSDFLDHVRPTGDDGSAALHEPRLRSALAQLAQGVHALHRAGKLHCDLKPGNVLVGEDGRLTILDFGLIAEQSEDAAGHTLGREVAGTPGYMAPEQRLGGRLTCATDYYAIGVMLFEALAKRRPLDSEDRERVPESLADLMDLSCALRADDAHARPDAATFLSRCGASAVAAPSLPTRAAAARLLGRQAELSRLHALCAALADGAPRVCLVSGPAGIGKSRLCHELAASPAVRRDALVLLGRCHARERVAFNAFDGVIDGLSRHVHRLPVEEAASLLPEDARLIGELFPVLMRLEAFAATPYVAVASPVIRRERAFAACRSWLDAISRRTPLVFWVDDLHGADGDSVRLLSVLLRAPAPRLFFVGSYREPWGALSAVRFACEAEGVALHELTLRALSPEAMRQLIEAELGVVDEVRARHLIEESGGNPFLLATLLEAEREARDLAGDLDALLRERVLALAASARSLLIVLALAGHALEVSVALRAAGLTPQQSLLTALRNERWLRLRHEDREPRLELYHERLATVLRDLATSAERARVHEQLAAHYAAQGDELAERAAEHFLSAGDPVEAAAAFLRSARGADRAMAFARAAQQYRRALALDVFTLDDRMLLHAELAQCLGKAGQPRAAASVFLQLAANSADAKQARALRRNVVQLSFASGSIEEGNRVLRRMLRGVGLDEPRQEAELRRELEHVQRELERRGFGPDGPCTVAAPSNGDEHALERADLCWAASAIAPYDYLRSCWFAALGLCAALDSGAPARIARALCAYATAVGSAGEMALAMRLLTSARGLVREDPELEPHFSLLGGQLALLSGDPGRCVELCDRARDAFASQSLAACHELLLCDLFAHMGLHLAGRLPELIERARVRLDEARGLGHRFAEAAARVLGVGIGCLASDDVSGARRQAEMAAAAWPQAQLHGERFKVLRLQVWCDLYEGAAERALGRLSAARAQALRSGLLSSAYWAAWWNELFAHATLAAAAQAKAPERRTQLGEAAERAVQQAVHTSARLGADGPEVLRVGLAAIAGRRDQALQALRGLSTSPHPVVAACARWKLAQQARGVGTSEVDGLAWVRSPERWTRLVLPGSAAL